MSEHATRFDDEAGSHPQERRKPKIGRAGNDDLAALQPLGAPSLAVSAIEQPHRTRRTSGSNRHAPQMRGPQPFRLRTDSLKALAENHGWDAPLGSQE